MGRDQIAARPVASMAASKLQVRPACRTSMRSPRSNNAGRCVVTSIAAPRAAASASIHRANSVRIDEDEGILARDRVCRVPPILHPLNGIADAPHEVHETERFEQWKRGRRDRFRHRESRTR